MNMKIPHIYFTGTGNKCTRKQIVKCALLRVVVYMCVHMYV